MSGKARMRVLVVEDDRDLAANIGDWLTLKGIRVDYALRGDLALNMLSNHTFDAVVLDWNLPGMSGLSVVEGIRSGRHEAVPVLMLTARDTLDDKLEGFDAGVDDYLVKPFALEELYVRLMALLRRGSNQRGQQIHCGDLMFDRQLATLSRDGVNLELKPKALQIVEYLMLNQTKVVSPDELEAELWGDNPPDKGALRVHIYAIRQAVDKGREQPLLKTVRGRGYHLTAESDEA